VEHWDKQIKGILRSEGFSEDHVDFVVPLIAEKNQQAFQQGFNKAYEESQAPRIPDGVKMLQLFPCHGIKGLTESNHCYVVDVWLHDANALYGRIMNAVFDIHALQAEKHLGVYPAKPPTIVKICELLGIPVNVSQYDSESDAYIDHFDATKEDATVIITGSHTLCKSCKRLKDSFANYLYRRDR